MTIDENKLIESGLKHASEVATKFLNTIFGDSAKECSGIVSDTVKFWRFKNQVNIIIKAKQFLDEKGIAPGVVPAKTLMMIMEKAGLEDSPSIQEKWAALLANAANPSHTKTILPSFVSILSELSSLEVGILDKTFQTASAIEKNKRFEFQFSKQAFIQEFKITSDDFDVISNNLMRLNIFAPLASYGGMRAGEGNTTAPFVLRSDDLFHLTPLGYSFIENCRRP
jgi:hypothetical protein